MAWYLYLNLLTLPQKIIAVLLAVAALSFGGWYLATNWADARCERRLQESREASERAIKALEASHIETVSELRTAFEALSNEIDRYTADANPNCLDARGLRILQDNRERSRKSLNGSE